MSDKEKIEFENWMQADKIIKDKRPHIGDKRCLDDKWICEVNDKSFRADAPSHCPYCGKDLRYDKYHQAHYRELRYYKKNE